MWFGDNNSGGTSRMLMMDEDEQEEEEIPIHGPEEPLTSGYQPDIGWYFLFINLPH